jgi:hypothetical protein
MNLEERKKYSVLIASMSVDYQMEKITWEQYIEMLEIITKKIKKEKI